MLGKIFLNLLQSIQPISVNNRFGDGGDTGVAPTQTAQAHATNSGVSPFDGLGKIRLIKLCRERSLDYKPLLKDVEGLKRLLAGSSSSSSGAETDASPPIAKVPVKANGDSNCVRKGSVYNEDNEIGNDAYDHKVRKIVGKTTFHATAILAIKRVGVFQTKSSGRKS